MRAGSKAAGRSCAPADQRGRGRRVAFVDGTLRHQARLTRTRADEDGSMDLPRSRPAGGAVPLPARLAAVVALSRSRTSAAGTVLEIDDDRSWALVDAAAARGLPGRGAAAVPTGRALPVSRTWREAGLSRGRGSAAERRTAVPGPHRRASKLRREGELS